MIFLRPKHYSNPSSGRRRRSHNRTGRPHTTPGNRTRPAMNSTRPATSSSSLSTQTHVSNMNDLTRQNFTSSNSHHHHYYHNSHHAPQCSSSISYNQNRRNHSPSISSLEFLRSITINERLASIGGLFGALSIIITGALLYAIFTAKSKDKWYYIIAVLINITLLILLMIVAILFDRFYLKRYSATSRRTHILNLVGATSPNDRVISINPTYRPSNGNDYTAVLSSRLFNQRHNPLTGSLDFLNFRSFNDIPPEYPGYSADSHSLTNKPANNINSISRDVDVTAVNASHLSSSNACKRSSETIKTNYLPPSYFDLYPAKNEIQPNSETSNATVNNNDNNLEATAAAWIPFIENHHPEPTASTSIDVDQNNNTNPIVQSDASKY